MVHVSFKACRSKSGLRVESIGGSLWVGVTVELGSSVSFKDQRWWKPVGGCHGGAWKLHFL